MMRARRDSFAWQAASRLAMVTTVAAAATVGLSSGTAFAEPTAAEKETARSLMKEGRIKREAGDHKAALEAFIGADAVMRVPTTGFEVGRSQQDLGLLVEARDTYLRVSRMPEQPGEPAPFKEAREQAVERANQLEARIPSVKLVVSGVEDFSTITVSIDGVAVPSATLKLARKINPGKHRIVAVTKGVKRTVDIDVKEGETQDVPLELVGSGGDEPEPAPTPAPKDPTPPPAGGLSPLVWTGFGVAGVGIVLGSVTGLLAMSKTSAAKEQCVDNRCPPSTHDDLSGARTMATVSTISFIAAAVGAGVGVYGLLGQSPAEQPKTAFGPLRRVTPVLGWGAIGLSGAF